jgi:hypothetical protein
MTSPWPSRFTYSGAWILLILGGYSEPGFIAGTLLGLSLIAAYVAGRVYPD